MSLDRLVCPHCSSELGVLVAATVCRDPAGFADEVITEWLRIVQAAAKSVRVGRARAALAAAAGRRDDGGDAS